MFPVSDTLAGKFMDEEHPQVNVNGKGLNATVTVGKRTIKFDGEKLILGEK